MIDNRSLGHKELLFSGFLIWELIVIGSINNLI